MRRAAVGLFTLGVLGLTQTRAADSQAEAQLEQAQPATTDTEIDGDKCVAAPVGRKSAGSRMDACQKLVAALGKLSSFSSRGKELSKRDLDNCNRGAR